MAKRTIIIDDERTTVAEASEVLGMSPMGLRIALRSGKFSYFGEAWKSDEENGERWTYYVNTNRLFEYAGIARARGVDRFELCDMQADIHGEEKEISQTEVSFSLELIKMEKELQKLKTENKKLKGLLNDVFTEISQALID
ncbi:hypothetical protein SDC9_72288 [bioreactor metagenome]|uniref:Uncharacterized protein n=1 Tax=bioreactor metagenome TaxID=1076179 RepID=A0A644YCW4_9ZZZZ